MEQVEGLDALNAAQGFAAGDALVRALADALRELDPGAQPLRARLGGSTFALLGWQVELDAARRFGQQIDQTVAAVIAHSGAGGVSHGVGAVYVPHSADGVSALLGEADAGVRQALAQTGGHHLVLVQHDPAAQDTAGAGKWREFISGALSAGDIALWQQPVFAFGDGEPRILQREITGSLIDATGEPVPAARFIPMALRFGLMPALDGAFLDAIFRHYAAAGAEASQIAVNLSMQSVHDDALVERLLGQLREQPQLARRMVFEISEFGLAHDLERAADVVARLRAVGSGFAVDNFGFHASAFQYLQQLRPDYIKLASSYLQDLETHAENQFFIASVVRVARPLDILTLACGVESDSRLVLLRNLGVSGYQGYAGARPQRLG
jgi:EAL domain-containing protein (putative c-di-GMP-specific phosphodiesterase class I)